MKKHGLIVFTAAALSCGVCFAANWLTDGGTTTRTGWNKEEHILTPGNVGKMHLLWKAKTDETPRALHSLITPLVVDSVPMAGGKKQVVYVAGVSDRLYAIDSTDGKIIWEKQFKYPEPPARQGGGPPGAAPVDPTHLNFLNPGGSSDTPVIGEADANGIRPIYITDGGGMLHTINDATGEEMKTPVEIGTSKFALQLYNHMIIIAGRGGVSSVNVDDPAQKVTTTVGFGGGGGLWGRRGPVITSDGTVWTTTGDGQYDPSNTNHLILGNSMVGFSLQGENWKVKDWFTPPNWDWLRKRDLDPNNTGTVFTYKGRELMAASGKECRVYLLDPKNMGGPDHHEPIYKTPLFCNVAADFQNSGSWGALSSWEDASGSRFIMVPFWGPSNPEFKFPINNSPTPVEGGEAEFKLTDTNGKLELVPVWISHDMHRGEPPIIANGMIFAYGSGENTQQAFTDIGLNFDSTIRASLSGHATIYVLDAKTGKELWNSGDQITSFSHFSGITVVNGKVYLGAYDGTLYCFGLDAATYH
jgi:outer membrane protein assembly factor BamB